MWWYLPEHERTEHGAHLEAQNEATVVEVVNADAPEDSAEHQGGGEDVSFL